MQIWPEGHPGSRCSVRAALYDELEVSAESNSEQLLQSSDNDYR